MQVFTQRKWLEEGRKRFGDNINHWKFICPACGRKQSIEDFNKQGIRYGFAHVYFCCISTFDTAKLCGFTCAAKWQTPITWGIPKVIRLHKWEVINWAGLFVPVFQFADAERKEQAVIRAVKPESFFGRSESARKARPLFGGRSAVYPQADTPTTRQVFGTDYREEEDVL
jgi:hypothetical protein